MSGTQLRSRPRVTRRESRVERSKYRALPLLDRAAEQIVRSRLQAADIDVGGGRPFDIQVHDDRFWRRVAGSSSIGLGESYMDGWWTCDRVDQMVERLFRASAHGAMNPVPQALMRLRGFLTNLQSRTRAQEVCDVHYDLGNDLFAKMLDPRMVYTCGYWRDAETLLEAQEAKLELVCTKLGLRPGMKVLDIGCGFGSFMKYAVERYDVQCVGYSLAKEQTIYGRQSCAGLPIEFRLEDYRSIRGEYDRVVSIGMFEAVGHRNYRSFMNVVARSMKPNGAALLHTMGAQVSGRPVRGFSDKYIFPNGMIPSLAQIARAAEGHLVVDDLHNFGPDYARTAMVWHQRFESAWPELSERYSERFRRMWNFYLLGFAGGFRSRHWSLWQLVLAQPGSPLLDVR